MKGTEMPKMPSKAQKEGSRESKEYSIVGEDQLILMKKVQKKILDFRDIMDLTSCDNSASLREVPCNYFLLLIKFIVSICAAKTIT